MPIFEYHCKLCGYEFEAIRFVRGKNADTECPLCGCGEVYKIISKLGIVENFEGYYETDIGNKPIYMRHAQDVRDAVARHNDGKEADKMGKLAIYDGIRNDRVKRDDKS